MIYVRINIKIQNEEQEDSKLRQLYQNRWNRQPSNQLSGQYLGTIQDFKVKLATARSCDAGIKDNIMQNVKFFEL